MINPNDNRSNRNRNIKKVLEIKMEDSYELNSFHDAVMQ